MLRCLGVLHVVLGLWRCPGVLGQIGARNRQVTRRLGTDYRPLGGDNYGNFQQSANIFSTAYAFMALDLSSGTAKCWGRSELGGGYNYGGKCDETEGAFAGLDRVYGGFNAFVLISSSSDRGLCSGHPEEGCRGFTAAEGAFHGFTDVFSNNYAMMALNPELGAAMCWGRAEFGGHCDFPPGSLGGYTQVLRTASAFLIVNPATASVKCWGQWEGGTPVWCDETPGALRGFTDVMVTTNYAVAFFNVEEGTMKCWGLEDWGGLCNTSRGHFSGFTELLSNSGAFLALDRGSGSIKCWGNREGGANCDETPGAFQGYTQFFSTASAFMALNPVSGSARCWGYSEPGTQWDGGGVCNETAGHFLGFSTIIASSNAFVALNPNSGTLRCWGAVYKQYGVACNETEGALAGFTELYCTQFAFLALNPSTGAAQCWGSFFEGGSCNMPAGSMSRFLKGHGTGASTTVSAGAGTGASTSTSLTAIGTAGTTGTTVATALATSTLPHVQDAGPAEGPPDEAPPPETRVTTTPTTQLGADGSGVPGAVEGAHPGHSLPPQETWTTTLTNTDTDMPVPLRVVSGAQRGHSFGLLALLPRFGLAALLICCVCGYTAGLMYAKVKVRLRMVGRSAAAPDPLETCGLELPFASLADE